MKPGDHPEFFRFPPPAGRSRESSIHLDASGRFWHEGEPVEHQPMCKAFATWISKHPDDGRYILTNGYDWTYFSVEDTPFFVTQLKLRGDDVTLGLSDGSSEALKPETLREGPDGSLYVQVKAGKYEARFTPAAQLSLAPLVVEADESAAGEAGAALELRGRRYAVPPRAPRPPAEP